MPTNRQSRDDDASGPFHFKRGIDIAVAITLALQILAGTWYASAANARLANHEIRIVALEKSSAETVDKLTTAILDIDVRLARIETQLASVQRQPTTIIAK
ncbi:hypothetical protein FHR90_003282 [Endobacter medicaginis]|uniref:Uncharacterized protein n=1 Tax=Endobacter medicaginis TaxID=1181271 RepID=A0A839UZV0_9PROT|nr:hypothetical protein [Endobacter medicaginis]MBB3175427.1 hypothetical protein [Endobacter medicaginis]MCX5477204.1 hypothetical protein [Endobacter medicaginis]NVN29613.1 hypothetical protein [Endobacter medicaginis]